MLLPEVITFISIQFFYICWMKYTCFAVKLLFFSKDVSGRNYPFLLSMKEICTSSDLFEVHNSSKHNKSYCSVFGRLYSAMVHMCAHAYG